MIDKALSVIVIFVICMVIFIGCDNMKFNQTTNKNALLTDKYSITQIEEIKSKSQFEHISYAKFKRSFNVQCIRKTHQGYYAVLLLEDDRNAFVFFNETNILTQVIVSNGFMCKSEFQNHVKEQMLQSAVLNFDSNTIFLPISAVEITAHIVQEGVFIVMYSRFLDGKIIEDPIITSINFVKNESIPTNEDPLVRDEIPFIFKLDKINE